MKRLSLLLCLIAVFAVFFSACTSAEDYQVLIFDSSDSDGVTVNSDVYNYWSEDNIDVSNVKSVLSVEIGGENYSGKFLRAQMITPNTYPIYTYSDKNNDVFSVDPNGLLTSYFWGEPESPQGEQRKLSETACLKIAQQFLGNIVDIDLYTLETEYEGDEERYKFTFTKYIDNQKTSDMAIISVLETGELYSYSSYMLGRIPADTQLDFDSEKATEAVYKKLDALYADAKHMYDKIEYNMVDQTITILESGDVAMLCYVDVSCITKYGENYMDRGERVALIVGQNLEV